MTRCPSGDIAGKALLSVAFLLIFFLGACDEKTPAAEQQDAGSSQTGENEQASQTAKQADAREESQLVPFNAAYHLTLRRGIQTSSIDAYEGVLLLTLENTCDGYITNQRLTAQLTNTDNKTILSDFVSSSWESRDWLTFNFNKVNKINNKMVEEVDNEAERPSPESAGKIIRRKPKPQTLDLPAGIQFPTQYSVAMLDAAQRGKTVYSAEMNDGSNDALVYLVTTFIGHKAIADSSEEETSEFPQLKGLAYWPVEMSYHDMKNQDLLPDFQIEMRLYENGLGTRLVMDYGEFALNGTLSRLEILDQPKCP